MNKEKNRFDGAISEDYDETFTLICPHLKELEESVTKGLLPLLKLKSNLRILDLGCGDGLTAKPILNEVTEINLVLLDNEIKMLNQAKDNLNTFNEKLEYINEDALEYLINTESNTFDGIASCFVIHNWKNNYRLSVLKEIYRTLKPNGIFVNADKIAEARPKHDEVFLKQLTLVIDAYTKVKRYDLLREWIVHYLEDNVEGVIWFESDAKNQLKEIGFNNIETTFRADLEATISCKK